MKSTIRARAPMRIGLCGGGSDLPEYLEHSEGLILNATISLFARVTIKPQPRGQGFHFNISDTQEVFRYTRDELEELEYTKLPLPVAVTKYFLNHDEISDLSIHTHSDVPQGSGLGGSSCLVVALVKAYAEFLNMPISSYDCARIAIRIERELCGQPGGIQDQYASAFGGFNCLEISKDRVVVDRLPIKNWQACELSEHLIIAYSNIKRTGPVIENQKKEASEIAERQQISSDFRALALGFRDQLMSGNFHRLPDILNNSWRTKKKMSENTSSNAIDDLIESILVSGARGAKLSGAGGGGFCLVFVAPENRGVVSRALTKFGCQIFPFSFWDKGVEAWEIADGH